MQGITFVAGNTDFYLFILNHFKTQKWCRHTNNTVAIYFWIHASVLGLMKNR